MGQGPSQERHVMVFGSQSAMKDYVVSRWSEISRTAIRENGVFRAALSGGKTPVSLYKRIAVETGLDWERTVLFQVDERFVSDDDPDNNFRMIRRTLVDAVPIPAGNLHPIPVPEGVADPRVAADKYESTIRKEMGLESGMFPKFDLILLGIGRDGHTASLFPGDEALYEKSRIVAHIPRAQGRDRITLTFPSINSSRLIIFYVIGKEKAGVFKKAALGDVSIPAGMVNPLVGEIVLMADPGAGGELS